MAARHARRSRIAVPRVAQLAAGGAVVALLTVGLIGPRFGTVEAAVADEAADGSPTTTVVPPPPPPPLSPLPVQLVASTPERPRYRVAQPGWAGTGDLLTNGRDAPLIVPGQLGRSVLIVPTTVHVGPQIQVETSMWRVFRHGTIPESALADAIGAAPNVPTILLLSGSGDPRTFVEAR